MTIADRAYVALVAFALALGVWVRCVGYFGDDLQLWLDEAYWARAVLHDEATWIRPVGYTWLMRHVVEWHNTEQTVRSLSLVSGVLQLPLFFWLLRRALSSRWVAWFGVTLLAVHPVAVAMSKEFKPYSHEAFLHAVLFLCALSYLQTGKRAHLIALGVVATLAPLFSWSVVFAYPAAFGVTALRALAARRFRDLAICVAGVVSTLVVLLVIFLRTLNDRDTRPEYWGKKYGVFFVGDEPLERLDWLLDRTLGLAGLSGRVLSEDAPASVDLLVYLAVVATLLGFLRLLARREWTLLALWSLPWLLTIAFNVAGKWPYGPFRTNVYLLLYAIGLQMHALDALFAPRLRTQLESSERETAPWAAPALLAVLTLLILPRSLDEYRTKAYRTMAYSSGVRTAMERIVTEEALVDAVHEETPAEGARDDLAMAQDDKELLLLDRHACDIFNYYAEDHEETKAVLGPFFSARFEVVCGPSPPKEWGRFLAKHEDRMRWVVSARRANFKTTRREVRKRCRVDLDEALPGTTRLMRCARERGEDAN